MLGPFGPYVATRHGAPSSQADLMRSLSFWLIGIRLTPSLSLGSGASIFMYQIGRELITETLIISLPAVARIPHKQGNPFLNCAWFVGIAHLDDQVLAYAIRNQESARLAASRSHSTSGPRSIPQRHRQAVIERRARAGGRTSRRHGGSPPTHARGNGSHKSPMPRCSSRSANGAMAMSARL